jgi:hypothetical protein
MGANEGASTLLVQVFFFFFFFLREILCAFLVFSLCSSYFRCKLFYKNQVREIIAIFFYMK